jgi:hypothetical protein
MTQQWKGVLGVLEVWGEQLDLNYPKFWAQKLKIADLLLKALAEARMTEP